ncbi:uncharacterized protein RJT20DRAFT_156153 [Scheffersomyces xylosifermentans]|uniref:uncharacterized protein n=1 Tax=Scheffersomyces xylosifermentans TaxID=1304137 RepID=UPI00315D1E6A
MVAVPEPIKRVFDTFPLTTYSPIQSTTPGNELSIEQNKYYFEGERSDASFCLGVHNVIKLDSNDKKSRFIPSDPVSLGSSLILCYKNNLKLPTTDSKELQHSSGNSMLKLSFHAAPDRQLPIFLVDDEKSNRTVKTASAIKDAFVNQDVNKNEDFNVEQLILSNWIDTKLFDLWILCLLNEEIQHIDKLFNLDSELMKDPVPSYLLIRNLYHEIPNWQAFNTRNPNLFNHDPSEYAKNAIASTTIATKHLSSYYDLQLKELENDLPLWIEFLKTDVLKNSKAENILLFKLVGFVSSTKLQNS